MKNNSKDKGFTLIEVLAVITIIGILSTLAVVAVNKVIQNGKQQHYVKAEDSMKLAGQSYFQKNRNLLPKATGQKTKVNLKVLVDNSYISAIKDYSDNQCDLTKSYVQVYKYSQNDYSYIAYLECPSYDSKKTMEEYKPSISVQFVGDNEKSAQAKITITDSKKLMSYSYIVYRGSKEVKNTGSVSLPNYDTKVTKTVDLAEYTPGKLKIVVTATNIYGNSVTSTVEKQFQDAEAPKCVIKEEDVNPKSWITSGSRKITVGCDDGDGSGCTRSKFSKTFKDTMEKGKITISDEAGNTTDCVVSVNIDKNMPSVPTVKIVKWKNNSTAPTSTSGLTGYTNNSWSNLNLYVEASNSTDVGSGLKEYQYVITGKNGKSNVQVGNSISITAEGTSKIKFRACDKAGNCSPYSSEYTIKLDKTAPSVPTVSLSKWKDNSTRPSNNSGLDAYTNNTWSNLKVYTVASSPEEGDDTSKIKNYQYVTTGATTNANNSVASSLSIEADGTSTIKYRVCDNAGNCSAYSSTYTVKVDKVKPTVTSVTNSSNGAWSNGNVTISAKGTDATSGVNKIYYYYDNDATLRSDWGTNSGTSVSGTWSAERNNEVFIVAIDNAGNRSDPVSAKRVRIDKTKPVITSVTNSSNGAWTNGNVIISAAGSDVGSGVKQIYYYYNNDATLRSDWSTNNGTNVSSAWSAERDNEVFVVAVDNVGNKSDPVSAKRVRIDKTKPTCSLSITSGTKNSTGNYITNVTAAITVNKNDSLSNLSYGMNSSNAAVYNGTGSLTAQNNGTYTYYGFVRDEAGNANSCNTQFTIAKYNCNTSGGTLVSDASKGYICVINSWATTESYQYTDTCTRTATCTRPSTCLNIHICGTYNSRTGKCSYGWYCATGWDGPGCYCNGEHPCEVEYSCTQSYSCTKTGTRTVYTCGSYGVYSGSGSSMKCYTAAQS